MTRIVTVANQKGGVAKTTTAVTLAHFFALRGKNVLIIDLDPQGQVSIALGLDQQAGVYRWLSDGDSLPTVTCAARHSLAVLPGNQKTTRAQIDLVTEYRPVDYLRARLKEARGIYDLVIFDTSPATGGLQERAIYASDLVIIPTRSDFLSAVSVEPTARTIQQMQAIGWDGQTWVLPTFTSSTRDSRLVLAQLNKSYPGRVLDPIHQAVVLAECWAAGETIWEYDAKSRAADEYGALGYRIEGMLR